MMSLGRSILFTAAIMFLALSVFPVAAQIKPLTGEDCAGLACAEGPGAQQKITQTITRMMNAFLSFVGLIAAGVLVYGGMKYVLARGDHDEAAEAKQTITYAVIGLIVIGLSAAIVNFVINVIKK